jgi:alpha 1,2-mannosyltransferase
MYYISPADVGPSYYFSKIYRTSNSHAPPPAPKHNDEPGRKANATFLILVRNRELDSVLSSISQLEDTFNRKYGYPYVFLNDEPFTDEFKELVGHLKSVQLDWSEEI